MQSQGNVLWSIHSLPNYSHSIGLRGGGCQHTSHASRGEDLEIEELVSGRDASAFHFHATLASVFGPTLIRDEVVQVLAAPGMM